MADVISHLAHTLSVSSTLRSCPKAPPACAMLGVKVVFGLLAVAANASAFGVGIQRRSELRQPAARSSVSMNLFGDLSKGLVKLQAGMYDEKAVKARLDNMIMRKCVAGSPPVPNQEEPC
jgi:hypothetical protein